MKQIYIILIIIFLLGKNTYANKIEYSDTQYLYYDTNIINISEYSSSNLTNLYKTSGKWKIKNITYFKNLICINEGYIERLNKYYTKISLLNIKTAQIDIIDTSATLTHESVRTVYNIKFSFNGKYLILFEAELIKLIEIIDIKTKKKLLQPNKIYISNIVEWITDFSFIGSYYTGFSYEDPIEGEKTKLYKIDLKNNSYNYLEIQNCFPIYIPKLSTQHHPYQNMQNFKTLKYFIGLNPKYKITVFDLPENYPDDFGEEIKMK